MRCWRRKARQLQQQQQQYRGGKGRRSIVGVDKRHSKWIAQIKHGGKLQHLGRFDDEREAAQAFDTARRRLRGKEAHGGRAATTSS